MNREAVLGGSGYKARIKHATLDHEAEFETLGLRLIKIAARVIETARTARVAFAASHPEADVFASLASAFTALGP